MTQAGDLLPEIKRRIALGWAAFIKVVNIMKSRKASITASVAEWLRAWDTLTMFEATVCGRS